MAKRTFRIVDVSDESTPYGLVDELSDEIVRLDTDPRKLALWAFDMHGADEVRHDEDCIKAETIPWRR